VDELKDDKRKETKKANENPFFVRIHHHSGSKRKLERRGCQRISRADAGWFRATSDLFASSFSSPAQFPALRVRLSFIHNLKDDDKSKRSTELAFVTNRPTPVDTEKTEATFGFSSKRVV
jgi:hypothetical protein